MTLLVGACGIGLQKTVTEVDERGIFIAYFVPPRGFL